MTSPEAAPQVGPDRAPRCVPEPKPAFGKRGNRWLSPYGGLKKTWAAQEVFPGPLPGRGLRRAAFSGGCADLPPANFRQGTLRVLISNPSIVHFA